MDRVLATVPRVSNGNVLVGYDTCDDAGVYQLTPELALVQTVDFFTPIVDDPLLFGAIAAANSLSDVYAMGGIPITALSILAYPATGDLEDLEQVLKGGAEKIHEANCVVIGGHSISDPEIKFGYSITGTVNPRRVMANSGARTGDALVFTKQLGTGIIATALKREMAGQDHVDAAIASMLRLNREACERMLEFDTHGCTDVTGFGLIGHAREMACASQVTLEIDVASVQFLPGALDYARKGAIPGGLRNNKDFASHAVETAAEIEPEIEDLLYDPQTSGGLLISLPERDAAALEGRLPGAYRIGRVAPLGERAIRLV